MIWKRLSWGESRPSRTALELNRACRDPLDCYGPCKPNLYPLFSLLVQDSGTTRGEETNSFQAVSALVPAPLGQIMCRISRPRICDPASVPRCALPDGEWGEVLDPLHNIHKPPPKSIPTVKMVILLKKTLTFS